MTESQLRNDFASFPAPAEGVLVALFITVRKVARSPAAWPSRRKTSGGPPRLSSVTGREPRPVTSERFTGVMEIGRWRQLHRHGS